MEGVEEGGLGRLQELIEGAQWLRWMPNLTKKREGVNTVYQNSLRRLSVGIGGHHWTKKNEKQLFYDRARLAIHKLFYSQ